MARKYVLDTHALVWFVEGNKRLSEPAKAILSASDSQMVLPGAAYPAFRQPQV